MAPITTLLLHALALGGDRAVMAALAPELEAQLAAAGIDSPLRQAHFLGQAAYESGYFARLEENLHYSAVRIGEVWRDRPEIVARANELACNPEALANAVYAGINGNGDEKSGDGWKYRGRGLFQPTGRHNYASIGAYGGDDLVDNPDCVAEAHQAVKTAIDFWQAVGANAAADADNVPRVTKLINGAYLGVTDRSFLKNRALKLLTA